MFLIGVFAKNQKANITPAERATLGRHLKAMAEKYRTRGGGR